MTKERVGKMLWAHCSERCRSWLQRTWKSLLHLSLYQQDQPFGNPWSLRPGGRAGARNTHLGGRGSGQGIFKDFIGVYKSLKGGCKEDRARLCARSQCQDQRPQAHSGTQEVPLNIRKHVFTVRVAKHWHTCPERQKSLHPQR